MARNGHLFQFVSRKESFLRLVSRGDAEKRGGAEMSRKGAKGRKDAKVLSSASPSSSASLHEMCWQPLGRNQFLAKGHSSASPSSSASLLEMCWQPLGRNQFLAKPQRSAKTQRVFPLLVSRGDEETYFLTRINRLKKNCFPDPLGRNRRLNVELWLFRSISPRYKYSILDFSGFCVEIHSEI